jgi:dihydroorotase
MIEIRAPDDFHHHLRDGEYILSDVLCHTARQFSRVIVMPNLQPPIRNLEDAIAYRKRIIDSVPPEYSETFTPLMTIYLTDNTTYVSRHIPIHF